MAKHDDRSTASARPRSTLERLSAPALLRLHAMPRWTFPAVTALLLLGGLLTTNAVMSAVLLGILLALLLWLISLSWSLLSWTARLMRILVLGALAMVIAGRLQGTM